MSEVYAQHVISELPKLTACDIDSKKINLCDALRSGGKIDKIKLEVASEMSDDKKKQIRDFIHGLVSSKPEILYTIKPEHIAGFKLYIGDTVFDATLSRTVDTSVANLR
jgi:F0F1-type ATP synthase delta subunit